jgi:hypothetical protein
MWVRIWQREPKNHDTDVIKFQPIHQGLWEQRLSIRDAPFWAEMILYNVEKQR